MRFAPVILPLLLISVATVGGWLWTHSARGEPLLAGFYAGQTGDGRGLQLALTLDDRRPSLIAHLDGNPYDITLDCRTNTPALIEFDCGPYREAERWAVTGLTLEPPARAVFQGSIFSNHATNGLPFRATNVATLKRFTRDLGAHVLERGGGKRFIATWPDFHDGIPFHESLTGQFAALATGEAKTFTAGSLGVIWEGFKAGGASWNWEGQMNIRIVWLTTNLISLCENHYEYSGGAHGGAAVVGRNFFLQDGKAREFALNDLFRDDRDWTNQLSDLCLAELRRQKAAWTLDSATDTMRVNRFTAVDLASFNVDGAGLIIHFGEYAVGPYADGLFDVLIPWAELKPWLATTGAARLISVAAHISD